MANQKLFEGAEKQTLVDNDRIATAIEGQEGASWISFANLYTQIKNAIIALFANKTTLDKLGDAGGALTYNGQPVANTQASGTSTEVQFRDATTGALDSDPLFKYDKATGVLNARTSLYIDRIKHIIGLGQYINSNIGDDSTVLGINAQAGTTSVVLGYQASGIGNAIS